MLRCTPRVFGQRTLCFRSICIKRWTSESLQFASSPSKCLGRLSHMVGFQILWHVVVDNQGDVFLFPAHTLYFDPIELGEFDKLRYRSGKYPKQCKIPRQWLRTTGEPYWFSVLIHLSKSRLRQSGIWVLLTALSIDIGGRASPWNRRFMVK